MHDVRMRVRAIARARTELCQSSDCREAVGVGWRGDGALRTFVQTPTIRKPRATFARVLVRAPRYIPQSSITEETACGWAATASSILGYVASQLNQKEIHRDELPPPPVPVPVPVALLLPRMSARSVTSLLSNMSFDCC